MDSLLSKAGKLRSLVKELKQKYGTDDGAQKCFPQPASCAKKNTNCFFHHKPTCWQSNSLRSAEQLKKEIANLDAEYDGCQEVFAQGEADGFFTEELLAGKMALYFESRLFCMRLESIQIEENWFGYSLAQSFFSFKLYNQYSLLRFYNSAEKKMKTATLTWEALAAGSEKVEVATHYQQHDHHNDSAPL